MDPKPPDSDDQVAAVTAAIRALDTPAPASLRAAVEAAAGEAEERQGATGDARGRERPDAGDPRGGARGDTGSARGRGALRGWLEGLRPRTLVAAGGAIAAVLAVVLVIAIGGGSSGSAAPTVADLAGVALDTPTQSAPAALPGGKLDAAVQSVSFPDWSTWDGGPGGGWQATGARSDSLDGRDVQTVFYRNAEGEQIGYSIADGEKLPVGDGRWARRNGVPMWIYDVNGHTAVMWYRDGLTCVVSGRGVDATTLQALAGSHPA
ncbi:hypothetical protein [Conexibacter sp. CPCC 206217]|uniref:hypothetical protein n=1 Tax=Conexibacter sp. CPCC 206217 TaxID=3064574 RepID=UPI00271D803C|nr:hypothetical protein [Conexibacter sp. CPCC 206217]MDO8213603.1 hypothetical protein [Conexibacter sp. CPCC 206217]